MSDRRWGSPGPRAPGISLLAFDGEARLEPGFLASEEADGYYQALSEELAWRHETATLFGRRIPLPRLTAWYGDVAYRYSGITHQPAPWPPVLAELADLVAGTSVRANAVLANLYRDGGDSMSWHSDDEAELGPRPVIASLSLGASRRFLFRHRRTREVVAAELSHGSLLVMSGDCQACWHHCLPKTARVTGPRINLTFRRMLAGPASGGRRPLHRGEGP